MHGGFVADGALVIAGGHGAVIGRQKIQVGLPHAGSWTIRSEEDGSARQLSAGRSAAVICVVCGRGPACAGRASGNAESGHRCRLDLHDSDERRREGAEALGDAALAELQRRGSSAESGTDLARDDRGAG